MSRYVTAVRDELDSGELSSLIGNPIFDSGDQTELSLTADDWSELIARRRRVGWPLHFSEAVTHE